MVHGMNLITIDELASLLKSQRKQTMISVVSMTVPKMKAKDANGIRNPFMAGDKLGDGFIIDKINKSNGTICGEYDRMVINKSKAEIIAERAAANLPPLDADTLNAEAAARPSFGSSWHRPLIIDGETTCLSYNPKEPSRLYLRFVYRSKGKAEYLSGIDGSSIETEAVSPFLAQASSYANQGLSDGNEVIFVVFALESILEIALNGKRYRILDNFANKERTARNKAWDVAEQYLNGELKMQAV